MIHDFLSGFFLLFNKQMVIVPVIGVGYWLFRRDLFSDIVYLLLLSMIVNTFLKCVFQVPLKPHLNQPGWYAFPSGHMQLSTVLYGRLWWEFRRSHLSLLLLGLLAGMGWGMIQRNYHDLIDILGGAFFGVLLMAAYEILKNREWIKHQTERASFILLPITAFLIYMMPSMPSHMSHLWSAQGGLLGWSIGSALFKKLGLGTKIWTKRLRILLLGTVGSVLIDYYTNTTLSCLHYPWPSFLGTLALSFWIRCGADWLVLKTTLCSLKKSPG